MNNILYLLFILLGVVLSFFSCLIINKKFKIISLEYLFYSYILFLLGFVIGAKVLYLILNFNIENIYLFFSDNIFDKFKFILSGYSFIGGYIGSVLLVIAFSRIVKIKKLVLIYLPSLILMYAVLKISCFIKGCCIGYYNIPVQLIESIISLISYFFILIKLENLNSNKAAGICFICFGMSRFLLSFMRMYDNYFSFIFVEIFCLFLIVIGIKFYEITEKTQK